MKAEPLDLTTDNRIRSLLEERERLAGVIREAEMLKRAVEADIREKLGDCTEGFTEGWVITLKTIHPREFTVPAGLLGYASLDAACPRLRSSRHKGKLAIQFLV